MRTYTLLFYILFILLVGCNREVEKNTSGIKTNKGGSIQRISRISPNHCIIFGSITKIDTSLTAVKDNNDPYSKYSCTANVRIDSVLGYGAGFPSLHTGEIVKMKFAFTLGPVNKKLFPKITNKYPGLNVENKFKADISYNQFSGNDIKYFVYGYQVR